MADCMTPELQGEPIHEAATNVSRESVGERVLPPFCFTEEGRAGQRDLNPLRCKGAIHEAAPLPPPLFL